MPAVKTGSDFADAADCGDEILVDRARTGDMVACAALMLLASATLAQAPKLTIDGSDPEYQDSNEADDAPVQRVAELEEDRSDLPPEQASVGVDVVHERL